MDISHRKDPYGSFIGPAVFVPGPLGRQTKKRCIIKDYRKTHLDARGEVLLDKV